MRESAEGDPIHSLKFINLTRQIEIGANSYLLEIGDRGIVLDSGMHPKNQDEDALPNFKCLANRPVDAILISHAHQDHIGTLPILMRRHPEAPVFMTAPTAEIGDTLLHNSVNVMTRQREERDASSMYPLFTHREADRAADRWHNCTLRQTYNLAGERVSAGASAEVTFEFLDAGHVLGAAGILIRAQGRTIFYTGDVHFDDQTIMQHAVFPESGVDVLIIETTHGNTPLPENFSRSAEQRRLADAIDRAFTLGGCILMPVFALGKTQETLATIHQLRREKLLGNFPIYIGGLSSKMTQIYDRHAASSRRLLPRLQLLEEVAPFILNAQTIRDAPAQPGRIYALSSGMMTPKTLSNIFARRVLEDPQHSIFFVGYADPASPAGVLKSAKQGDPVQLDEDEPMQPLRCNIEKFQFSAHASRESIMDYVKKLAPKKIILVHGDPLAVEWVHSQLIAALPSSEVIVPKPGAEVEL
ncbi:MAG: MBL fold metallo-hydrolase [Verrucomicrobiota bacterium]